MDSGEFYIFSFLKEKAVFSTNYVLVEAALDEVEKMTLGRDLGFINVSKHISGRGLFNVYINHKYFTRFLENSAGRKSGFVSALQQEMLYSGISFNITPDGLISLEGYTSLNDTTPSTYTALLSAGNGSLRSAPVIPERIASMVKISFDDIASYYQQSLGSMEQSEKESYLSAQQKVEKRLKISVTDHFLSWIDNEIVLLQTAPSNLGRSNEFAAIMVAKSNKEAEENLYFIGRQIKRNSPVKIKEVPYHEYTINYISFPGLLRLLFGKLLERIEKPYYTIIENYVIFSNHPQTIKNLSLIHI